MVQINWYPLTAQAKARPMPVLPLVHSMMVPPGLSWPLRSAASTMLKAMRSLTLWPGLKYSTFAKTGQGKSAATLFRRIMGVLPMAPRMFSWMIMTAEFGGAKIPADSIESERFHRVQARDITRR